MKPGAVLTAAASLLALLVTLGIARLGATAKGPEQAPRLAEPIPARAVAEAARAPAQGAEAALVSQRIQVGPTIDGNFDEVWSSAKLLRMPLASGRGGDAMALEVTLGSLHTQDTLYFWAQWPESVPETGGGTLRNKITLHFDIREPWPGAHEVTCLVACHTAFVDDGGHVAHLLGETIPPGRTDPLTAAGAWEAGMWRLEWSRPLVSENGFDVQFKSLDRAYPFFVKVFAWTEGQADPVSADHVLVFQP